MRTRPTALTAETAEKIIAARRRGLSVDKAAARGGVTRKTVYEWLARGESDSPPATDAAFVDFAIRYREAEADRQEHLLTGAEAEGPNAKDKIKILEISFPQDFGARQIVEHTGADGGAIQIDDARARLMALLDRHASKGGAGEGSSEPQSS